MADVKMDIVKESDYNVGYEEEVPKVGKWNRMAVPLMIIIM